MWRQVLGLSSELAKAEFKLRNEGSYLGILWYLLNPLLMFILLLAIFSTRLGQNIPSYPLYLLLGIIIFNIFQQTTIESTKTIKENRWIIKSIRFPHEVLIFSIVLKNLFSHILEFVIFTMFLLFFGVPVTGAFFYSLILVFLLFFISGVSFILSALTVYFIDLDNIWAFVSRLLWLGTPIFYSIEGQENLLILNLFNPMYYFITVARDLVIYGRVSELWVIAGVMIYSLLSLVFGLFIFKRLKRKFAELI